MLNSSHPAANLHVFRCSYFKIWGSIGIIHGKPLAVGIWHTERFLLSTPTPTPGFAIYIYLPATIVNEYIGFVYALHFTD